VGIRRTPHTRQASVCGSATGRFTPAAIRQALLFVLHSTFPARRPQTEAEFEIYTGDKLSGRILKQAVSLFQPTEIAKSVISFIAYFMK